MVRNYINGLLVDQYIWSFAKQAIGPTKPHRGHDVTGQLHRPRLLGSQLCLLKRRDGPHVSKGGLVR
jgi:hypothetical protein